MASITINMLSPHNIPVTLTVEPGDETEEITNLLARADGIGLYYEEKGWRCTDANSTGPGVAELAAGPTFAGYACSPTVDDNGLPTWIIVDGRQAQRREKQGDVWYSIKREDGYDRILTIPKGETAPPVQGI